MGNTIQDNTIYIAQVYSQDNLLSLHDPDPIKIDLPLPKREVDFSVDNRQWIKLDKSTLEKAPVALAIFTLGLSILLRKRFQLPRNFQIVKTALQALCGVTLFRYILQRILMIRISPVQSRIVRQLSKPDWQETCLNKERKNFLTKNPSYIFRDVVLEKNGIRYSGILLGLKTTINNGKWALQATGSDDPVEYKLKSTGDTYLHKGYNVLMINGPGEGKSEGTATPSTMGDAQEVGISYLETALKAKNIVIAGHSFGGATIGQAILQHEFKTDKVEYTIVFQIRAF